MILPPAQGDISMVEFRIATHQLGLVDVDVTRLDGLYAAIDAKPIGNGDGWVDLREMNAALRRWRGWNRKRQPCAFRRPPAARRRAAPAGNGPKRRRAD